MTSPISLALLTDFLGQTFGSDVVDVHPLNSGAWSQAFGFSIQGEKRVIRLSDHRENFDRDQLAATYHQTDLPIPQIYDIGQAFGGFYCVSEFAEGSYFETSTAADLEALTPSVLRTLQTLREVDLRTTQGYGGWNEKGAGLFASWKDYLLDVKNDHSDSLIAGWRDNLAQSSLGMESFDRLYAELTNLVTVCPETRELIHSDLINFNVLVADHAISAVLDWGSSKYGDSLYDLAWIVFYEPWYPEFTKAKIIPKMLEDYQQTAKNTQDMAARLRCYLLHIGLDSIGYNAFKQDWHRAQEAAEYTQKLLG